MSTIVSALLQEERHLELYQTSASFRQSIDTIAVHLLPALVTGLAVKAVAQDAELEKAIAASKARLKL